MKDGELLREMLDLVRDQQTQNAKMMESMMTAHSDQAKVFEAWLEMFKPSAQPLTATSPDDRVKLKEAREAEEWDVMLPSIAEHMLRGEGLPNA